jgi:hypothetical protein
VTKAERAVGWHQSGREGDSSWFDKAERLGAAIDSLLELRSAQPADVTDEAFGLHPTDDIYAPTADFWGDTGELARLRTENARFRQQLELLDDPDGLYSEAKGQIEERARVKAVKECVQRIRGAVTEFFGGLSSTQVNKEDLDAAIQGPLQSLLEKKEDVR